MHSIFAKTEWIPVVDQFLEEEPVLKDLYDVKDIEELGEAGKERIIIDARGIIIPLDWSNETPPYLISNPLPFRKNCLLGYLAGKQGDIEKSYYYLAGDPVLNFDLSVIHRIQQGEMVLWDEFEPIELLVDKFIPYEIYRLQHNRAIVAHYAPTDRNIGSEELNEVYQQALQSAPNGEYRAYTARYYAMLLMDMGYLTEAGTLLSQILEDALSDDARYALKALLANVRFQKLSMPYQEEELNALKELLWETLQYYEQKDQSVDTGLLLIDAAQIAAISNSFSESLGYIQRAISIFEEAQLEELKGNALVTKGRLLYIWAQNGHPQFYKNAVETYQEALKIFTRQDAPSVFAEIHHNLGVLYSEMPADNKKRGIWAAVSATSFQEALAFFTKDKSPYEYGMVCNNYGNALTKYPASRQGENIEKALDYYREALSVRQADRYPYERALTLLNFLEASWDAPNPEQFNQERYEDMLVKAHEIIKLVEDPQLISEAERHLARLEELNSTQST